MQIDSFLVVARDSQSLLISSSSFVLWGKKGARIAGLKKNKDERKGDKLIVTKLLQYRRNSLAYWTRMERLIFPITSWARTPRAHPWILPATLLVVSTRVSLILVYLCLPVHSLVSLDRRRVFRVSVCSCGNACTRMSSPILPSPTFRCNHVGLGSLSIYRAVCNVCKHMVSAWFVVPALPLNCAGIVNKLFWFSRENFDVNCWYCVIWI